MKGYWDIVNAYSRPEIDTLSLLKRLADISLCDADFRDGLQNDHTKARSLAISYGFDDGQDDLDDMLATLCPVQSSDTERTLRLRELWRDFNTQKAALLELLASYNVSRAGDPFGTWRSRNQFRLRSEIGTAAKAIPHALVAFELSKGCSVGCSFCGIDAAKFGGHAVFDTALESEWRAILDFMRRRFGKSLNNGFLYWGTDPLDSPYYLDFARIFYQVTGVFPQVTTAIPLRDVVRVREILAFAQGKSVVPHRFSILSKNVFRRTLATFTPEELLHVELIGQHSESQIVKANAGRALDPNGRQDQTGDFAALNRPTTIACVTGFLVNIAERSIKMVSPTYASSRWPNGYIVFGEQSYSDAESFERAIEHLVGKETTFEFTDKSKPRFRSDLALAFDGEGFSLASSAVVHKFPAYGAVARAIATDDHELGAIISSGTSTIGENLLFVRGLYKAGLIELVA